MFVRRHEAIALLKEISDVCGDGMQIDSVSLYQDKIPTRVYSQSSKLTNSAHTHFKVHLRSNLDLNNEKCLTNILQKRGLKMAKDNELMVIYGPTHRTLAR